MRGDLVHPREQGAGSFERGTGVCELCDPRFRDVRPDAGREGLARLDHAGDELAQAVRRRFDHGVYNGDPAYLCMVLGEVARQGPSDRKAYDDDLLTAPLQVLERLLCGARPVLPPLVHQVGRVGAVTRQ
jgi:hypothetical protein